MLNFFKGNNTKTTELDKLFYFMTSLTRVEQSSETYNSKYNKLKRQINKKGDAVCINLYLSWEDFLIDDSAATNTAITKKELRNRVKSEINIDSLSQNFKLIFLEEKEQLSYLYGSLINDLTKYVKNNLGEKALYTILKDSSKKTIFENIVLKNEEVDFDKVHQQIRINPSAYPVITITKFYKAFISTFYNKIEVSLGEKIAQGIFKKIYENFKETYSTEFASLLLNVTPEKVLSLDEWLSLLSKSELEKQVKEKTAELENLNNSLEERITRRTAELKKAYDELKELDQKKSEFISVAAHQIRTPVSSIKWILDMFLKKEIGEINDDQKNMLEKAYSAIERLLSITNELLDTDLIASGQDSYQIEKADMSEILNTTTSSMSTQAKTRNVNLILENDLGKNNILEIDYKKIKSVIENILDNSIKYSKENGEVTIKAISTEDAVSISIKDSGIGIPKESKDDLFKRFYRAPNATRLHANGSGLGLFIAKNIIERHSGHITFESIENQGTTFTITLPRHQPNKDNQ